MHPTITAQALTEPDVDRAFPLVREADRALTLEDWRHFATARASGAPDRFTVPGIIVARRNGLMRGLAALERDTTAPGGPDLNVDKAIIVDRTRRERVARELLAGFLSVARREGCARIRVSLPPSSNWLAAFWSDPDGTVFHLPVDCVPCDVRGNGPAPANNVINLNIPAG